MRHQTGIMLPTAFLINIAPNMSISQLLNAGRYQVIDDDVSGDHFLGSQSGSQVIRVELVHLDARGPTSEVLAAMSKLALRPARVSELLTLGADFPELVFRFPLVALGEIWRDEDNESMPYVVCLAYDKVEDARVVDLVNVSDDSQRWGCNWRFLGVAADKAAATS